MTTGTGFRAPLQPRWVSRLRAAVRAIPDSCRRPTRLRSLTCREPSRPETIRLGRLLISLRKIAYADAFRIGNCAVPYSEVRVIQIQLTATTVVTGIKPRSRGP